MGAGWASASGSGTTGNAVGTDGTPVFGQGWDNRFLVGLRYTNDAAPGLQVQFAAMGIFDATTGGKPAPATLAGSPVMTLSAAVPH